MKYIVVHVLQECHLPLLYGRDVRASGSSIRHAIIVSAMSSGHQQEFQEQDLYCGVCGIPVSVLKVIP
ncbi:unnamed protein product [Ectocarpus sp. 4 AP-2014]